LRKNTASFICAKTAKRKIRRLAVYVSLDMEYPRLALIRVDAFDRAPVDLRETMK